MVKQKQQEQKKVKNATVINQQILLKAVKDYLNENKIIPKQSINFGKIKVLSLSFLNIWRIQYLDSLVRLQKLQLDNNVIQVIENLGHLTKLKWLDLSFNNIQKIQGLQKLQNLADLSLYNNKIKTIEGLLQCKKLNIFSIGNNQIKSFQQVISYFGRSGDKKTNFKYLQVLNVYGNPFTIKQGQKDQQYQYHLVSHLPNLRYLDYIFIDDKRRKQIRDFDQKFKTQDQAKFILELKLEQDKQKQQKQQEQKKKKAKMHLLNDFQQDIVKIDDLQKIKNMRDLQGQMQKFKSKIKQLVQALQKRIKQQNQKKIVAIKRLQTKLHNRQDDAQKQSLNAIAQFESEYKNSKKIIQRRQKNWKQQVQKVKLLINKLRQKLMGIQIELVQDTQNPFKRQIMSTFDVQNEKLITILSKQQKQEKGQQIGYFKKMQDQIRQFGIQLDKISKQQVALDQDKLQKRYQSQPDLLNILINKDSIGNFISSIKQALNQKRNKKQSQVQGQLCGKQKQNYKKQFQDRQYQRNRNNIKNIKKKIDQLKYQLDLLVKDNDEDL